MYASEKRKQGKLLATVVMATYNSAKTLQRALDSIVTQDYPYIETIVIDGASTDSTLEILRAYKRAGKITKLVSEPDQGIYDALNKGIGLATGDIIGFLGSDDYYFDGAITSVVKGFKESNADVVYGGTLWMYSSKDDQYKDNANLSLEDFVFGISLCHQSVFVRTELQKHHPFKLVYRACADYHFLSRLYYSGYKFFHINVPIAAYSTEGFSSTQFYWGSKDSEKISKELMDIYPFSEDTKKKAEIYNYHRRLERVRRFLIHRFQKNADCRTNRRKRFLRCERKLILFGTGLVGERFLQMVAFVAGEGHIASVWDNSPTQQDILWNGLLVESPHPGVRDAFILIASSKYESEMAAQLDSLGYVRGCDYLTWSDSIEKLAALYARRRWHFGEDMLCALEMRE